MSEVESQQSSSWRELKAIYLLLKFFANKLVGHTVEWLTDNQRAVYIIRSGSRKEYLQDGPMDIFELYFAHSIKLKIDWIPQSLNEYANTVSRIIEYNDWSLNPSASVFSFIDASWGPHAVDCFSSRYNRTKRFHGFFWSPGCEAVDTFTVNWGSEINLWPPPQHLVCRTIHHASRYKVKRTLVVLA